MTQHFADQLEIHPASPAEREAAYRNVHEVWGRGLPIDEHVRQRLESPKHQSATWFVGSHQGRVLTSLGAYPIQLSLRGRTMPAVAIGSVHTLPECRGQGLAPRLLRWVERHLAGQGIVATLLYSDIDPRFYARLGYQQCPSWYGWHQIGFASGNESRDLAKRHTASPSDETGGAGALGQSQSPWQLEPFDPRDALPQISAIYARCHGRRPLAIARNEHYWWQLYQRGPSDEFFWLGSAKCPHGYVRLTRAGRELRIVDYAIDTPVAGATQNNGAPAAVPDDERLHDELYRSVIQWAQRQQVDRVGGWLPANAAARRWFRLAPRTKEITMVKSLDKDAIFDNEALQAAEYFCEIDHV